MLGESAYAPELSLRSVPWRRLPAFRRARVALCTSYYRLSKPRYLVEVRNGVRLLLDQENMVDRHLLCRGEWEPMQLALLREMVAAHRPSGCRAVFLDVGAHGGYYALVLARKCSFDEIIAFEPDPMNAAQLWANLFLNDMSDQVRVVPCAAAGAPGRLMITRGSVRNRGKSRVTSAPVPGAFAVDAVRVDDVLRATGAFVVCKIDVEGAELDVLKGLEQTVANNKCIVQVESFADNVDLVGQWFFERGFVWKTSIDDDHFFIKSLA